MLGTLSYFGNTDTDPVRDQPGRSIYQRTLSVSNRADSDLVDSVFAVPS